MPILPSDVMRNLSETPPPDALVFNINVEPPATYGPIDASPAKTCLWAGGRAEHESRASSSTYTKRLRNLLIPMIKSRPSPFHSPPPPFPFFSPMFSLTVILFSSFSPAPVPTQ